MKKRVGIWYFSRYGQTEKIVEFMAKEMDALGWEVGIFNLAKRSGRRANPSYYDAVLIGAPIYVHRYSHLVEQFVRDHRRTLNQSRPVGFFSVCLAASSGTKAARREAMGPVYRFLDDLDWSPSWVGSFAGALKYKEYGWILRAIMRKIASHNGGPTDTRRDYELTRWDEVAKFARDFANQSETSTFRCGPIPILEARTGS